MSAVSSFSNVRSLINWASRTKAARGYLVLCFWLIAFENSFSQVIETPVQKPLNQEPKTSGGQTFSSNGNVLLSTTQLLESVRDVIAQPPLSAEKIAGAFRWRILAVRENPIYRTRYTSFGEQPDYFANPHLTEYFNSGQRSFFVQLFNLSECIRSTDVFAEFGATYKPIFAMANPVPNESELPETVRRNRKLFLSGPEYIFSYPDGVTRLAFEFHFSECVKNVSINQEISLKDKP